ncbi:MAG: hypothetical protein VW339_09830 [Quisquiliibacterium sp.]
MPWASRHFHCAWTLGGAAQAMVASKATIACESLRNEPALALTAGLTGLGRVPLSWAGLNKHRPTWAAWQRQEGNASI